MVSAWFYNAEDKSDPREKHQYSPNRPVSLEELAQFGVLYKFVDASSPYDDKINALCKERDYKNRDYVCITVSSMWLDIAGQVVVFMLLINVSPTKLPDYENKIKTFFEEHLHEDEEIRYIVDGSGFFDVRDKNDKWIRIAVNKSDLIILPAGIYHRFILDTNNYLQAMRLFKEDPKWTPLNRSAEIDQNKFRKEYVRDFVEKGSASL
ncbi:acireductone dioxygenase [Synchytrium microbalum]|uniref:Acireductone dioxygenase n=1 Tax=Synchytrium microbalum TaxID=1806994 RepID=A0A507BL53_9FUNG|nr:acireductone dioxygenase [Synchytrium microbalum]TPX31130.1 acireductone dioxygenase [Synchytrium microbalum]